LAAPIAAVQIASTWTKVLGRSHADLLYGGELHLKLQLWRHRDLLGGRFRHGPGLQAQGLSPTCVGWLAPFDAGEIEIRQLFEPERSDASN
jgi:hypothetical protein